MAKYSERNITIYKLYNQGMPVEQIAQDYAMTRQRIYQILKIIRARPAWYYIDVDAYARDCILGNLRAIAKAYINLSFLVPNTEQKLEMRNE